MFNITLLSFHLFQGPIIIIVVAISHKWSLQFQFLYIISLIPGQPGTIGVEVDCLTWEERVLEMEVENWSSETLLSRIKGKFVLIIN